MMDLKIKQLLSYSIKRYLISKSIGFKEYNLFSKILKILDLPIYERLQWLVFFKVLPYRLMIYRNKRLIENKYNS